MVCGGLAVFNSTRSYRRIIVPNSGGGLWWFAVVCGGLWWFVVVCGGLWWFVVDCGGLSFSHTRPVAVPRLRTGISKARDRSRNGHCLL